MSRVKEFNLPDLGEGLTEGEILSWLVKVGDTIELNQPIVEVETAKAAVEIPAKWAGRVQSIFHAEGDTGADRRHREGLVGRRVRGGGGPQGLDRVRPERRCHVRWAHSGAGGLRPAYHRREAPPPEGDRAGRSSRSSPADPRTGPADPRTGGHRAYPR